MRILPFIEDSALDFFFNVGVIVSELDTKEGALFPEEPEEEPFEEEDAGEDDDFGPFAT